MSEFIRTILIMSISGSVIAILLFVLKPLVRNHLPKSVQYYLWLVVIAALIVPVSKLIVLTNNEPSQISIVPNISETVARYAITQEEEMDRLQNIPLPIDKDNPEYLHERRTAQSPFSMAITYFVVAYPIGSAIVLLYTIITFTIFTRRLKRRNQPDEVPCDIPVFRNPLAATPMLIGLFRPAIILPDREYTYEQLHAVLLHELTHLRRKDVLIKWLSVLATALHWFNPIVWLVRREIDRACELSCDEAVIRNLDTEGKQNYGETLIYVAGSVTLHPMSPVGGTMAICEDKKALKERLGAIMKSKKHTRLAILVSAVLIIAVGGTAIALSAGQAEVLALPDADAVLSISMNQYNDYTQIGNVVITDKNEIAQILNDLSGASKLWGMSGTSVNDYPVDDNFLVIDIAMQNEGRRLSLYSSDYIEEPYIGVYRAKHRFDYMYSLYSAHLNDLLPKMIAEDATVPVVTLYGFDQSKDNGDSDDVKRHFTGKLLPDANTGVTVLTDMIFIDVCVPVGSVSMRTFYAESNGVAYRMSDNKWSPPHQYSSEELLHPSGNTFSARDINPDGFTGSIWAVTTDVDGVEHTSDVIPVIWVKSLADSTMVGISEIPQQVEDENQSRILIGEHGGYSYFFEPIPESEKRYVIEDYRLVRQSSDGSGYKILESPIALDINSLFGVLYDGRILFIGHKSDEVVDIKSECFVSMALNGTDRRTLETLHRGLRSPTFYNGLVYYEGWTKVQTWNTLGLS